MKMTNNWQIKIIWRSNRIDKKNRKFRWVLFYGRYGNKELEFKIFKLKLAHLSNIIDKK